MQACNNSINAYLNSLGSFFRRLKLYKGETFDVIGGLEAWKTDVGHLAAY